jgi:hypothetical protein
MGVKLHRCRFQFVKLAGHPCWRVEKALIDREDGTWYREGRRRWRSGFVTGG